MANEVRCTWFFSSLNFRRPVSWTETLWARSTDIGINEAIGEAARYANYRCQLLGDGVGIVKIRASVEGVWRDSLLTKGLWIPRNSGKIKIPLQSDYAQASQKVRMESGSRQRRYSYLGGIPDDLQVTNDVITDAAWKQAFSDWAGYVKEWWSFFGLVVDPVTNRPPPKVPNPTPPPEFLYRPHKLYPITEVKLDGPVTKRRGRPLDLYRGRS